MTSPWSSLDRPPLREAALRRALQAPHGPWRAVEVVERTASTNADVAARARDGEPDGLVLVADHQHDGRGRLGRIWTTPPRSALTLSVLLRLDGVPAARLAWLTPLAALAVADTATLGCGLPAAVKWPNDVLVGPHETQGKVCGVLAETVAGPARAPGGGPAVVLGIGLNVTQTQAELPASTATAPRATSLRLAGSASTDRDTVLRDLLRRLADRLADFRAAGGDPSAAGLAATYRERSATLGRLVQVHLPDGTAATGAAEEIDDDGSLVVRLVGGPDAGTLRVFAAGDVVHLRG